MTPNLLFLYIRQIWENKKNIFIVSIICGCIGVFTFIITPPRYETYVIITLEDFQKTNSKTNNNLTYNAIQNNAYSYIFSSTPFLLELLSIPINLDIGINKIQNTITLNDFIYQSQKQINTTKSNKLYPIIISKEELNKIEYLKKHIQISVNISKSELTIYSTFPSPIVSAVVADSATHKLNRYINNYYTYNKRKEYLKDLKMLSIKDSIYRLKIKTYSDYKDKNKDLNTQISKIKEDSLLIELLEAKQDYNYIFKKSSNAQEKLFEEKKNFRILQPAFIPQKKSNASLFKCVIAFFLLGIIGSSFYIIFIKPIIANIKYFTHNRLTV